jgi:hypothetical protein
VDFTIPEELTALRKSYGTFLDREVRPVEESLREEFAALEPDHARLKAAGLACASGRQRRASTPATSRRTRAAGESRRWAPACWSRMPHAAGCGSRL